MYDMNNWRYFSPLNEQRIEHKIIFGCMCPINENFFIFLELFRVLICYCFGVFDAKMLQVDFEGKRGFPLIYLIHVVHVCLRVFTPVCRDWMNLHNLCLFWQQVNLNLSSMFPVLMLKISCFEFSCWGWTMRKNWDLRNIYIYKYKSI